MESLKACKLTETYKNKNEYKNIQNCPLTLHPVLIDFGKSRAIAKAKGYRRGDVDYLAPEVKAGKKESTQSDIFSFGKMLEAAVRGRSFLPTFSELITSTTAVDASKRPSVSEVAHFPLDRMYSIAGCSSAFCQIVLLPIYTSGWREAL